MVKTEKKLQSTPQSQSCTKKWSWSLFGGLLAGLIYYSFLNPRETITPEKYAQKVDEIHQKLLKKKTKPNHETNEKKKKNKTNL